MSLCSDLKQVIKRLAVKFPVVKFKSTNKTKRNFTASLLQERSNTEFVLHWYNNEEYKQLSIEHQKELRAWRLIDEGKQSIKAGMDKLMKKRSQSHPNA